MVALPKLPNWVNDQQRDPNPGAPPFFGSTQSPKPTTPSRYAGDTMQDMRNNTIWVWTGSDWVPTMGNTWPDTISQSRSLIDNLRNTRNQDFGSFISVSGDTGLMWDGSRWIPQTRQVADQLRGRKAQEEVSDPRDNPTPTIINPSPSLQAQREGERDNSPNPGESSLAQQREGERNSGPAPTSPSASTNPPVTPLPRPTATPQPSRTPGPATAPQVTPTPVPVPTPKPSATPAPTQPPVTTPNIVPIPNQPIGQEPNYRDLPNADPNVPFNPQPVSTQPTQPQTYLPPYRTENVTGPAVAGIGQLPETVPNGEPPSSSTGPMIAGIGALPERAPRETSGPDFPTDEAMMGDLHYNTQNNTSYRYDPGTEHWIPFALYPTASQPYDSTLPKWQLPPDHNYLQGSVPIRYNGVNDQYESYNAQTGQWGVVEWPQAEDLVRNRRGHIVNYFDTLPQKMGGFIDAVPTLRADPLVSDTFGPNYMMPDQNAGTNVYDFSRASTLPQASTNTPATPTRQEDYSYVADPWAKFMKENPGFRSSYQVDPSPTPPIPFIPKLAAGGMPSLPGAFDSPNAVVGEGKEDQYPEFDDPGNYRLEVVISPKSMDSGQVRHAEGPTLANIPPDSIVIPVPRNLESLIRKNTLPITGTPAKKTGTGEYEAGEGGEGNEGMYASGGQVQSYFGRGMPQVPDYMKPPDELNPQKSPYRDPFKLNPIPEDYPWPDRANSYYWLAKYKSDTINPQNEYWFKTAMAGKGGAPGSAQMDPYFS